MNIFRVVKDADVLDVASQSAADETLIPKRESWLSERKRTRRERDAERGYSINIKQVVLAFAVEFWIIGLIVVGTYQLIDDSGKLSQKEVFSALLLPAALARCPRGWANAIKIGSSAVAAKGYCRRFERKRRRRVLSQPSRQVYYIPENQTQFETASSKSKLEDGAVALDDLRGAPLIARINLICFPFATYSRYEHN